MKKISTIYFLLLFAFQNLFGQNCNLQFGIKNDTESGRYTNDIGGFRICKGIPVNLTADEIPNASYQWYLDSKIITDATQNIYEVKDISGRFTVKATVGNCSYSRSMESKYTSNLSYTINSNSESQTICEQNGNEFLYTSPSTTSNKNAKYQWQKDKIDIEGANNYYYNAQKSGFYSVRVSQGECNTITPILELKAIKQNIAKIIIGGVSFAKDTIAEFCAGTSVQLSIERLSYSDYKVYKDEKLISLGNYANISESGKYRIEVTVGDCKLKTPTIDVRFGNNLPKFYIEKVEADAFKPCNIEYLVLGIGTTFINSNNFTAEWRKNGITQQENGFSFLNVTTPGTYSILLKKGSCQRESEKLEIKSINSELIPLRTLDFAGKKLEGCYGQGFVLNPYAYSSYATFDLYKDGKVVFSQPNSNGNIYTVTESGKYYLIYSEPNGGRCTRYSDTLEIIIKNKISNTLSLDNSQCQNGVFKLSVPNGNGLIYTWKKDGKILPNLNTAEISVKETGNYSVVINQEYCSVASPDVAVGAKIVANSPICEGQSLQLSAGKANAYEWTGPNGFTSKIQNPNISKLSLANQGQYQLKIISDNNCIFKDSITVKVNPSPVFSVQVSEVICLGKSFTITAKSSSYLDYYNFSSPDNWSTVAPYWTRDNVTQQMAGVYTISATDPNTQCKTTTTAKVTINTNADCPSIVIADLSKLKLCEGTEVEIPFSTSGKFATNTIFTVNSVDFQGNLQALGSGTKSPIKVKINSSNSLVITSNDRNISSSPSSYLNVTYANRPNFKKTNLSACTGYQVDLKVDTNATYYKFDKIQWKLNGKVIEGATKPDFSATQSGSYSVDVTQYGCTSSTYEGNEAKVIIGKLDKPYAFSQSSTYVCDGFSVNLLSNNYPKDVSFQWNLDGKSIDKMNASTLKATKKGVYTITIKQGNCEATSDTIQVFIGDILPNGIISYGGMGGSSGSNQIELCKGTPYFLYYAPYWDNYVPDSVRRDVQLQWQKDGIDIEKADSLSYKIEKDGNYRLKISQGTCVAYSKTTQIKFSNQVKLRMYYSSNNAYSSDNKNILACSGDSVQLYFYGSGEGSYYFPTTIYGNNKVIKELPKYNNSFYTSKSGNYWVRQSYPIAGSQETCIATSDTINVKIGGNKIDVLSENITTCLDTIRIYNNSQNGKMRWKFNDNYLPKDTLYSVKAYKSGTYQWEATTKNCQFISKPFTVTFGKLEATLESPYKELPCYGEILGLFPNIKSSTYYYGDNDTQNQKPLPSPTFQWQKDGIDFGKTQYLSNVQKGIYSLTIKQGKCSVTTNPVTIDYKKISRDISPKDSATFCPNGGFVELLSAADVANKYTWIKDKKTIPNQIKSSIKASEIGIYQAQIESGECATLSYPVKISQKIILPTAAISGSKEINVGDSTRIKIDLTSSAPWTIKLTNNQLFTADKTPYEFLVKPTQTTIYELVSVKNVCGEGTVSGKAEVKIIVLGNEEIEGAKIKLFPIPAQNSCQLLVETLLPEKLELQLFSLDGKLISKTEKSKPEISHIQTINLESAPSGTYLLKIIIGEKMVSRKIIKEN